jgi:hypothetical protein
MTFFHKVRIGRNFFQLGEPRLWIIFKRFQHHTLPYATNADFIALEAKFPGQAHSLAASVLKKLGELGTFCHGKKIFNHNSSYSAPNDLPLTVNPSLATMAGRTWPP